MAFKCIPNAIHRVISSSMPASAIYISMPLRPPDVPAESMNATPEKAMKAAPVKATTVTAADVAEAMSRLRRTPMTEAQIKDLPPGSSWGNFHKRKDGTIRKYTSGKTKAMQAEEMKPRPAKYRTVTLAEVSSTSRSMSEADIKDLPPGSRWSNFRKVKDGTIRKYKYVAQKRPTLKKQISVLRLQLEQLKEENENLKLTLGEKER